MTRPRLILALRVCVLLALAVWYSAEVFFLLPALVMPPLFATCTIFADDFSTDRTGTDYTTVAGTWAVSGGVLTATTASAAIVSDTAITAGLTGATVSASITPATTSDKGRVITAYTDSNTYWFAEVQPGANNGLLSLYQRSGGSNTLRAATKISGFQATEAITVSLTYSPTRIVACVGSAAAEYSSTITVASTKGGMGTGAGSSDVDFDNFNIYKHSVDDATCSATDCSRSCTVMTDDFAADDTALLYTVVSGSFTVSGGEISTTSATPLIVTVPASGTGHGKVLIKAKSSATGNTARVVGAYVSGTTYAYGELTFNGASSTWKLFNGAGTQLGNTRTLTTSTGTYYNISICWDGVGVSGTVSSTAGDCLAYQSAAYTGTGTKAGFGGTRSSGTLTYDDFSFTGHSTDNVSCDTCGSHLDTDCDCVTCSPQFLGDLDVEIAGSADNTCTACESLDGVYRLSRRDAGDCVRTECCSWRYQFSSPCAAETAAINVELYKNGANYEFYCTINYKTPNGVAIFIKTIGTSKPDCESFNDYDIPWSADAFGANCDHSGATFKLTAVPLS